MGKFRIMRSYKNHIDQSDVVKDVDTREEAVAHCLNPETSSETATRPKGVARTALYGEWFDWWTEI